MSAVPSATAEPTFAELRTRFRDGKAALLEEFRAARASATAAARLLRALTRQVDRNLVALWERTGMPDDAALIAVGGYGRGELLGAEPPRRDRRLAQAAAAGVRRLRDRRRGFSCL